MLKRQSTTAKVTRRIARLISEFCRQTDNGVMARIRGEEIGLVELDEKNIPSGLCVYKATLQQLERLLTAVQTVCRFPFCSDSEHQAAMLVLYPTSFVPHLGCPKPVRN